jgi:hypothetical protein
MQRVSGAQIGERQAMIATLRALQASRTMPITYRLHLQLCSRGMSRGRRFMCKVVSRCLRSLSVFKNV